MIIRDSEETAALPRLRVVSRADLAAPFKALGRIKLQTAVARLSHCGSAIGTSSHFDVARASRPRVRGRPRPVGGSNGETPSELAAETAALRGQSENCYTMDLDYCACSPESLKIVISAP